MLYSISALTKVYDKKRVLSLDFLNIEKKKIYALTGPNGAGKTTLLNILAFLELPSSGKIYYDSHDICFSEICLQALRKKVVMVSQNPVMFTMSLYKNLEFGLKVRKISKKKRKYLIDEALDMVGMRHFAKAMGTRLSSGETQRAALARAVVLSPDVILCDEPISSVDTENQEVIKTLLKQINKEKQITLIFTTHDKRYAASLADHILFLNKGKFSKGLYDNFFTGFFTKKDHRFTECDIRGILSLKTLIQKTGKSSLTIDPEKIIILDKRIQNHNKENCFQGKIVRTGLENNKIRIKVELKIFITILISEQEYMKLKPMIGDKLLFFIPYHAMR